MERGTPAGRSAVSPVVSATATAATRENANAFMTRDGAGLPLGGALKTPGRQEMGMIYLLSSGSFMLKYYFPGWPKSSPGLQPLKNLLCLSISGLWKRCPASSAAGWYCSCVSGSRTEDEGKLWRYSAGRLDAIDGKLRCRRIKTKVVVVPRQDLEPRELVPSPLAVAVSRIPNLLRDYEHPYSWIEAIPATSDHLRLKPFGKWAVWQVTLLYLVVRNSGIAPAGSNRRTPFWSCGINLKRRYLPT